jgi:hypothetical protein
MAHPRTCSLAIAQVACGVVAAGIGHAEENSVPLPKGWADDVPAISSLVAYSRAESDLRAAVTRYVEDRAAIQRRYPVRFSPVRAERLRRFHESWRRRLGEVDFDSLNHEGRVD